MNFRCHRGVYIRVQNKNQVLGCTFNNLPLGFPANPPTVILEGVSSSFAIYEHLSYGFQVSRNTVNLNIGTPTNLFGIVANDCGGNTTSWIYYNFVNNQRFGITSYNKNRMAGANNAGIGVQVQCNQFENNYIDIYVHDPGTDYGAPASLATPQGLVDGAILRSAGNDFNGSTSAFNLDEILWNTAATNFTYYFLDPEMVQAESNAADFQVFSANQCSMTFLVGPEEENSSYNSSAIMASGYEQQIAYAEIAYETDKSAWQAMVDNGDTEGLTDEVLFTTFASALNTYQSLMDASPKLSEEVMIEAIKKEYDLPSALLTQILKSNPTAARSAKIDKALDERLIPLTEYQREEILEAQEWVSQKENLEWAMAHARNERTYAISQLWDLYLNDPEVIDPVAKFVAVLKPNEFLEDRFSLVEIKVAEGNYTEAITLLESFDDFFKINDDQQNELTQLITLCQWKQTLSNGGGLSEGELSDASLWAEQGSAQVAAFAVSLTQDLEDRWIPLHDDEGDELRSMESQNHRSSSSIIYPNPTENYTTIRLLGQSLNTAEITIADVSGRVVKSILRTSNAQEIFIDLFGLSEGTYHVFLLNVSGNHLESLLLVKQ